MKPPALLLPLLVACAPASASREPAHYSSLSKSSATPTAAAFEPAPELVPAPLGCRDQEPALANALDDDCDGRIDGADATLALVLAYPRTAALQLSWQSGEQAPASLTAPPICAENAAFCTVRLGAETLPHGAHTLLVQATDEGAASLPSSLLVSVQAQGKAAAYLLRIESAGAPRVVGRLLNP